MTSTNIQVLRCIAAILVLGGHVQDQAVQMGHFNRFDPVIWQTGVDIFFVVSGFIMYHISADQFGAPGASTAFLKRRLLRVVPLYWLFTTAMVAALFLFKSHITHNRIDPAHVAASYAFIPWPRGDGELHPVLGLGWTLNYEAMFYMVFALALALPRRLGLAALIAIFVVGVAIHPWIPKDWWIIRFWSDPIILEFLAGVGLACLHRARVRLPFWGALAMVTAGIALMVAMAQLHFYQMAPRSAWGGLPATLICAGMALGPQGKGLIWRALSLGGDASYSLYLSHPFSINIVGLFAPKFHLNGMTFVALSLAASLIGAGLSYGLIERPLMQIFRRQRNRADLPS